MKKLLVLLTAHDPLHRFDPLLRVLEEYEKFPTETTVVIYVDYEHREDEEDLDKLIRSNISEDLNFVISVAPPEYKEYYLCWAHKDMLRLAVTQGAYDYYLYSENDMLFTPEHFEYWLSNKENLKKLNLEPSWCRYEEQMDLKIPFDNYKQYNVYKS